MRKPGAEAVNANIMLAYGNQKSALRPLFFDIFRGILQISAEIILALPAVFKLSLLT